MSNTASDTNQAVLVPTATTEGGASAINTNVLATKLANPDHAVALQRSAAGDAVGESCFPTSASWTERRVDVLEGNFRLTAEALLLALVRDHDGTVGAVDAATYVASLYVVARLAYPVVADVTDSVAATGTVAGSVPLTGAEGAFDDDFISGGDGDGGHGGVGEAEGGGGGV
ncbi:hypothetical protein BWQ96_01108 [Gracilariopsis chorda]|uniref:Uncharacterized protein n=1 Tax=Gracilariopsis chorda TaxID=448386 RepID=A0A2V3J453_9FLOR|nr:hypothetical protein BWQ96_01108 [Gracilariopsis chorda]|eukprot:PXF49159.1 hypothetical protein BWQ96_01108 [Gracilariopsis chorda]